jgi:hypothetical protein
MPTHKMNKPANIIKPAITAYILLRTYYLPNQGCLRGAQPLLFNSPSPSLMPLLLSPKGKGTQGMGSPTGRVIASEAKQSLQLLIQIAPFFIHAINQLNLLLS